MNDKHKKNLRAPPDTLDFSVLFHFIMDHGIGQVLNRNNDPVPWNDALLEAAFMNYGYSVDQRSIQNWHSGKNLPSIKNIQALASVISCGDLRLRRLWADALLNARHNTVKQRSIMNKGEPQQSEQVIVTPPSHNKNSMIGFLAGLTSGFVLALCVYIIIANFTPDLNTEITPKVVDIRFCDDRDFSENDLVCQRTRANFLTGTQKIYVSFKLNGMRYGQPFERKWYRDGEEFLSKSTYYDDAWSDYTYIYNSFGHPEGDYVIRIVIDDKVTTGRFTVINEN